jgi:hypothetical protein
MKNIYIKIFLSSAFSLLLYLPQEVQAQCNCALGVPATALKYNVSFSGLAGYFTFNMPKFNPALGTLSCMRMDDTITSNLHFRLANRVNNRFEYNININQTASVTGPSGFVANANYGGGAGPYDLGVADFPPPPLTVYQTPEPDTVKSEGPISIFSTKAISKSIGGGPAAYLGVGTVPFTFDLSGPVWAVPNSGNYGLDVQTVTDLKVTLTYFYCPTALLASKLQKFSAHKIDRNIVLNWEAPNEAGINQYDIEYSTDGSNFTPVAKVMAGNSSSGAATYAYNYALNSNSTGAIYFRIKETGNNDKSVYSTVQKVIVDEQTATGISIHPNPAITGMSVNFDRPMSGEYTVDLVNLSGQLVVSKKMQVQNSRTIPVSWTSKPAPGVYYTRIINTSSRQQQIVRVIIQ